MKLLNSSDQYTPYSFFDEIYAQRRQPEFGMPPSPWRIEIRDWKFIRADNRDVVPIGFADSETDDRDWENVCVPSVWQQSGYGAPTHLQYDPEVAEQQSRFGFLRRKLAAISSDYKDDDVGIYRARIDIPGHFQDRSVYLLLEGVCGRFEVYLNGTLITASGPVYAPKKLLLSGGLTTGMNLITLLVFRFESVSGGVGKSGDGTNGFSGIFRAVSVVADSLLELRSVSVETEWTGPEYEKDAYLDVYLRLYNHTDLSVSTTVDYKLIAVCDEYDIYNLPEIRLRPSEPGRAIVEPLKTATVKSRILARGVSPWSHATPNLYDLVVIVKDSNDRVICVQKRRIGFRTVKESDRKVLINDCPVPLKATRYFSFDPQYGLSVPPERMLQDVLLMKRAHLNTVLIPHFPADPLFFDLCDRYGLYVICPLDREDPTASAVSFSAHPCVIIWSMKLDSRDEALMEEIRDAIGSDSGSGLFYCLYRDTGAVSEFDPFDSSTGALFGEWQDLCLDRRFREEINSAEKSGVTTDAEAGEGNASEMSSIPGRNDEIESERLMKYIHQADLCKGFKGAEVAIAQGIVDAFREKHPEYETVRRKCETVTFLVSRDDPSKPTIINSDLHGPTGELELKWSLILGGREIRSGGGIIASLPPGAAQELSLGFQTDSIASVLLDSENGEDAVPCHAGIPRDLLLNLRALRSECRPWTPFGFEVASCQTVLLEEEETDALIMDKKELTGKGPDDASSDALSVASSDGSVRDSGRTDHPAAVPVLFREEGGEIRVEFGGAQANISRDNGGITKLSTHDYTIIQGGTEPYFYRASANSERYYVPTRVRPRFFSRKRTWREIQKKIRLKKLEHRMENESLIVSAQYISPALKGPIIVDYRFSADGKLTMGLSFQSRVKPPRFGFRLHVASEADSFRWYGYGPGGLYAEETWSPHIGIYEAHSADLFHRYARPSENGARKGTRLLEIVASEEAAVIVKRADKPSFTFTATPYLPENIDDCRHDEQLPNPDGAELFLDFDYTEAQDVRAEVRRSSRMRRYQGSFVLETKEVNTESSDLI